jgi:Tfp pilus assembly protein PilV
MLTTAAIIVLLLGVVANLAMQVWVLPRTFRADNQQQALLITSRFDAQLKALETVSSNAVKTLDEAARFFKAADERFQTIEHRLFLIEEMWKTTRRLVEKVNTLDKRFYAIEQVCNATHERSLRTIIEQHKEDDEL